MGGGFGPRKNAAKVRPDLVGVELAPTRGRPADLRLVLTNFVASLPCISMVFFAIQGLTGQSGCNFSTEREGDVNPR